MSDTIGGNLLKYLGLVGTSGMNSGLLVPRAATPASNERLFSDFERAGDVADPDVWTRYASLMARGSTSFGEMLRLWSEMAEWDLMKAAMVQIVDEATQVDTNSPGIVWYQCNDREFEEELNDMLVRVQCEDLIQSQIWHVASLGNHFEKLEYAPQEGVISMSFIHPMDIRRYWLERNHRCIGFKWTGHDPKSFKEAAFVAPDNQTPIERVSMSNGKDLEELWYPWDVLHFRRIFRLRHTQHGEPIFEEAQGIYKKLRMAIDQMVVHRAQVQPDRYSINIDVQEQPPIEQMKTVQRWKQALRSKLAFGQGTGSSTNGLGNPTDFTSYYNAWGLDTILYVAQPKGFQHAITKIPGTAQVPDVYDIELLTDLFYSIIGMPRSWFGGSKDSQEAPSGKSLLAQDIRFLRKVKSIRHPIIQGYTWLGYFHAVLKGKDVKQLDIKAMMPPIGGLEEQMKLEMLKMQSEVMSELADVMAKYRLPKEAWVETIFKRYMHLPDDVLNVFLTALPLPVDGADAMERTESQWPAPAEYKIIREVEAAVARIPRLQYAVNSLKHGRYMSINEAAQTRVRTKTYADPKRVMHMPEMKDYDIIINSLGEHPMRFEKSESMGAAAKRSAVPLTEAMTAARKGLSPLIPLQETVQTNGSAPTSTQEAYRRYMPEKY